MSFPYHARRERLLSRMTVSASSVFVVSHLPNIRYLCGFTGSNGLLMVTPDKTLLYTDPRYTLQAADETDCDIRIVRGSLWDALPKATHLTIEGSHLSFDQGKALSKRFKLQSGSTWVEELRQIKDSKEIAKIRSSMELAAAAFQRAVSRVRPATTEKELAADIDHEMRLAGAEGPAFETIVAAGRRSALPHARPTGRAIGSNQLLLIDMGASLDGYASDMTRVLHMGKPGRKATLLHRAVLEAQLAAIDKIRAGVKASDVDRAARRVLARHGLAKVFEHSTGHGLGLEIHEGPRLGRKVDTPLKAGMVVTVEPGAYLKNFGGVRIEDTVLVTQTGVENLTPIPKELLVL